MITKFINKVLFFIFCSVFSSTIYAANDFELVSIVTRIDLSKNVLELSGVEFFLPNSVINENKKAINDLSAGDKVSVFGVKQIGMKRINDITVYVRSEEVRKEELERFELNKNQYIFDMEKSIR